MRLSTFIPVTLVISLWTTLGLPAFAQASDPQAAPPDRLIRNEDGFSIDLAGGFELGKEEGGYFLLGSRTVPGLILIKPLRGLTAAELDEGVTSGYRDERVQLTPVGEATELSLESGSAKLVEVSGALLQTQVRGLLAGYLRPGGGGLLLFAVTAPSQWQMLEPFAERMARSVALFEPNPDELIRFWKQRLGGFRLVRGSETKQAPQDKENEVYSLCGDGSFVYEAQGAAASAGDSVKDGAPQDKHRDGSWKIIARQGQAEIEFSFQDGRTLSQPLRHQEYETYLGSQRYFVVPNPRCP